MTDVVASDSFEYYTKVKPKLTISRQLLRRLAAVSDAHATEFTGAAAGNLYLRSPLPAWTRTRVARTRDTLRPCVSRYVPRTELQVGSKGFACISVGR